MKLYLVDGTFELFRCFHGAPRARFAGREVGAIRGLVRTLASLLRTPRLTHIAVAFDAMASPGRVPRRAPPSDLIRSQADLALDAVRALGITVWPMVRFQADDALATAAARWRDEPSVDQVVICTTDNDLAQCVLGDRVALLDRIHKRTTDEAGVMERFGVRPEQMPAWFALVGDRSDGLPGIPRWGKKATATVLGCYGTLDAIPRDASDWAVSVRGAAGLAASLADRHREALLYRNLSVLRTDVPLPDALDDLRWTGVRDDLMQAFCAAIGEPGLPHEIADWATRPPSR